MKKDPKAEVKPSLLEKQSSQCDKEELATGSPEDKSPDDMEIFD